MRIGVLMCGWIEEKYHSISGDYNDMVTSMLEGRDVDLVFYDTHCGQLPHQTDECDGYLIMGSKSSVYDGDEWIDNLEGFVRESVRASLPVFGICFGLQVIATALGGRVEEFEGGWGVGAHTMTITERRSWMESSTNQVTLLMTHKDQVVQLPRDAVMLGSSVHCENNLVEFAQGVVGIQGHPEFVAPFMEALYRDRSELFGELVEPAIASLGTPTDNSVVVDWIMGVLERG